MRFLLAFALCFVSVFASAQAPMVLGGPQGIDVTRILARNWMSIPTYTDTPAAPLTGSGWPARGFIIHVAKSGDTAVWQYTGKKWAKIGGVAENNYTYLVSGGGYTKALSSNNITVSASTYYIKGLLYSSNTVFVSGFPKTANANGRIDAVVLGPSGASIIQGTESANPASPSIPDTRLKIGFIYYQPFDTLPQVTGNELTSVFRKPGRDSLYFTSGETTIAVKDSIGISRNDTASMLTNYVNTASNGLTKTGKDIRLGGTLNQQTRIALGGNAINIAGSADSTRFFGNGSVAIGYRPNQSPYPDDSTYRFAVNGTSRLNGVVTYKGDLLPQNTPNAYTLGITQGSSFGALRAYTNGGVSPMQQLEFGYLNTSLNTTGGLSNPTHSNFGLRVYGGLSAVDSGGGSYTNFRISPTINYNTNFKKAFHMGFSYEPTVQSLNNTTHIAFRNTRGSNLFNVNSGNTLIGYDTTSSAYQVDTTYKLDVNGNGRFSASGNTLSLTSPGSRIFFGNRELAIGEGATSTYEGTALGWNANATTGGVAIGKLAKAPNNSVVIGNWQTDIGNVQSGTVNILSANLSGIGIGGGITSGLASSTEISIGGASQAIGAGVEGNIAIGREARANGNWAIALGSFSKADAGEFVAGSFINKSSPKPISNVYFGSGKQPGEDTIGLSYTINGSGAKGANFNGGNITIAGGKSTGTGTPGSVIFSTSSDTTSGTALQTLKERARISPTGNLLIGTSTDGIYKLDVNGSARINGNGQKLIFTNDNGQTILGSQSGDPNSIISASAFGDVVIGFGSKSMGVNGGQAIGFQSTAKEKGVAIGTAGAYAIGGVAIGKYSTAEFGEFVVGGAGPVSDPFIVKNVYFGSGKNRARYIQSGDSLTYRPGGGDTCTINGSGGNGTNQNGGGLIIAGGKGTGTGSPGYIGFSTSSDTTSGTALQTLKERARISPTGNLLVGRTVDSIYKLDVNGDSRVTGAIYQRMDVADSIGFARSQSINLLTGTAQPTTRRGIFIGNGTFNNTSSNVSIGIGHLVNVGTGTGNVAIGYTSNASGGGIAIGSGGNTASATLGGIAIGQGATTNSGVAVGTFVSSSNGGLVFGSGSSANASLSIALGSATSTNASQSVAIGHIATANNANSIALGLLSTTTASNQLVIGGNDVSNGYGINDVYIGSGVRNASKLAGKDVTYNGSGAGDSSNMAGGNIRIAGGKGTGTGTPGSVIFSTSSDTTSGTALQTLKERARISPTGNLLVGRTVDSIYKLDVNGQSRLNGTTRFTDFITSNDIKIGTTATGYSAVVAIGQSLSVNNYNKVGGGRAILIGHGNNNDWGTVGNNDISIGQDNKLSTTGTANGSIQIGTSLRSSGTSTLIGSHGNDNGFDVISIDREVPPSSAFNFTAHNQTFIRGQEYFLGRPGADSINITINGNRANLHNKAGGNLTISSGTGKGSGTASDIVFTTSSPLSNPADSNNLQTQTSRVVIKGRTGSLLVGTTTDNSSAIVNISSTTQGFLPPRMTGAQAELIGSPAEGLMIYSTDGTGATITSKGWWGYNGSTWVKLN